jgi:hypothetical protein
LTGLSEIGKALLLNSRPVSMTDSKTTKMILAALAAPAFVYVKIRRGIYVQSRKI